MTLLMAFLIGMATTALVAIVAIVALVALVTHTVNADRKANSHAHV